MKTKIKKTASVIIFFIFRVWREQNSIRKSETKIKIQPASILIILSKT